MGDTTTIDWGTYYLGWILTGMAAYAVILLLWHTWPKIWFYFYNKEAKKSFYAFNRTDIDAVVAILQVISETEHKFLPDEIDKAKIAKLTLELAINIQSKDYLLDAMKLSVAAGNRVKKEIDEEQK